MNGGSFFSLVNKRSVIRRSFPLFILSFLLYADSCRWGNLVFRLIPSVWFRNVRDFLIMAMFSLLMKEITIVRLATDTATNLLVYLYLKTT